LHGVFLVDVIGGVLLCCVAVKDGEAMPPDLLLIYLDLLFA
jgi:hypothetical protein